MGEYLPQIRIAVPADIDFVVELENAAFRPPWTRESLEQELVSAPDRMPLIAEVAKRPVGYAFVWIVANELHLVTIAVLPSELRKGVGACLMEEIFRRGKSLRSQIVTLEVRAGNSAARGLYRAFGFKEVAIRPRYYPDDHEDAIVMLRELLPL